MSHFIKIPKSSRKLCYTKLYNFMVITGHERPFWVSPVGYHGWVVAGLIIIHLLFRLQRELIHSAERSDRGRSWNTSAFGSSFSIWKGLGVPRAYLGTLQRHSVSISMNRVQEDEDGMLKNDQRPPSVTTADRWVTGSHFLKTWVTNVTATVHVYVQIPDTTIFYRCMQRSPSLACCCIARDTIMQWQSFENLRLSENLLDVTSDIHFIFFFFASARCDLHALGVLTLMPLSGDDRQ